MSLVLLGNPSPQMTFTLRDRQGAMIEQVRVAAAHLNQSVTRVEMWDGFDKPKFVTLTLSTDNDRILSNIAKTAGNAYAIGIHEVEQLWGVHCRSGKPAWVDGDDLNFVKALGAYYDCPVGQPTALLTNVGQDAINQQIMGTSTQPAAFNYIALTASTTAPAVTDTILTGEIVTGGGGLIRAQATFAHTTGTNTSTLTKTFTANGSDSLPVTIAQIGVFNAASSGTLCFHTALSGTATLSVIGDNVTITEQVTT